MFHGVTFISCGYMNAQSRNKKKVISRPFLPYSQSGYFGKSRHINFRSKLNFTKLTIEVED